MFQSRPLVLRGPVPGIPADLVRGLKAQGLSPAAAIEWTVGLRLSARLPTAWNLYRAACKHRLDKWPVEHLMREEE